MKLWILPAAGLVIVAVNGVWDIISEMISTKSRKKSERRYKNSRKNKHTLVY